MKRRKVLFLDKVHACLGEALSRLGYICETELEKKEDELFFQIKEYTGIVLRSRIRLGKSLLKEAKNLEFIARSGSGLENIDTAYARARGILCFNAPEGNRNAVAEHALGMLLGLFNRMKQGDMEVRQGKWNRERNRGVELSGKTVGIIGYGNNGSAFAEKLSGMDVEVLAYDKYKKGFGDACVKEVSMRDIFRHADIVSLHIPLSPETESLVNNRFIEAFHHPFYLINISRGRIVDTEALMRGVEEKRVLGACLDVLEFEHLSFERLHAESLPRSFRKLITSDKILLTPHVAGWTKESYEKLSLVLAEKISAAVVSGKLSPP